MRINELITPQEIEKKSYKDFNPNISRQNQASIELDRENYGRFSKGSQDPKDPHAFNKRALKPLALEKDAYYNYIQAAKPLMQSNPYFPRVYKITVNKDRLGQTKPIYSMEKLHPDIINPEGDIQRWAHEQQVQAIQAVADRMFTNPPDFNGSKGNLGIYLMQIAKSGDYSDIKDSKLKQALEVVANVQAKGNFRWDLHSANLAFRLTRFGPQLVLMDPLS